MNASLDNADSVESLVNEGYQYGFVTDIEAETAPPGLDEDTVRFISAKKQEPEWLLEWRLKAFRHWLANLCVRVIPRETPAPTAPG